MSFGFCDVSMYCISQGGGVRSSLRSGYSNGYYVSEHATAVGGLVCGAASTAGGGSGCRARGQGLRSTFVGMDKAGVRSFFCV